MVQIDKGYQYATVFTKMSYPIQIVARQPNEVNRVRPLMVKAVENFKSRLPSNMWPIADGVMEVFEGYAAVDTQRVITAMKGLIARQKESNDQNVAELGQLQVKFRQYAEGKVALETFISGPKETSSGFSYPYYLYLIGVANEGLGDKEGAVDCFRQMLGYWGKADIELKEIKDARERLARLTS